MNREIKFRAWDDINQYYFYDVAIYPDNVVGVQRHNIESEMLKAEYGTTHWTELGENAIIEQYTGLKDKNGKEIYEGDIVKAKIDGFWQTGAHTVSEGKATWNLEVVYNDIRYMDVFHILGSKNQPNRIYYLFDESISDIEVIGNVHENPELLGGKE